MIKKYYEENKLQGKKSPLFNQCESIYKKDDFDKIDYSNIEDAELIEVYEGDILYELETWKKGKDTNLNDIFSKKMRQSIMQMFDITGHMICSRIPEPKLTEEDLKNYKSDYKDLEDINKWEYSGREKIFASKLNEYENDINVIMTFEIRKNTSNSSRDCARTSRTFSFNNDIIPIMKELLALPKPKNAWARLWCNYSYNDIQKYIQPVYEEYLRIKEKIDKSNEREKLFVKENDEKQVLCVTFKDSNEWWFFDGLCGFDIFEKHKEIQTYLQRQKKASSSYDEGEKSVEYAIEWFIKANSDKHIVTITGDCESKYRFNCILLNKPDFIDDPQEYDHILVCPAGVILIETKNWKDRIEIREDGKWIRENGDETKGIESPAFQIRRHELMMKEIIPNINIHNLLCFSNPKIIIDGRENFTDCTIITIEQLEKTLTEICSEDLYTSEDIDRIVNTINEHKVNIQS